MELRRHSAEWDSGHLHECRLAACRVLGIPAIHSSSRDLQIFSNSSSSKLMITALTASSSFIVILVFAASWMNREPELPLAPAKKKPEVGEGLGTVKGYDLLLMGVPRGSPMNRVTEELVGSVSVGGRDVDMGVTSIRVCGFALGGVGELAIKTGDTDRPMSNRAASRKDVGRAARTWIPPARSAAKAAGKPMPSSCLSSPGLLRAALEIRSGVHVPGRFFSHRCRLFGFLLRTRSKAVDEKTSSNS